MTEFKNGAYEPGVYVKGEVARRAQTPSEAARYVWDGYVRQADEAPKSEKVAEPEATEADKPEETEKRGPGRPRKPAGGDQ